MEADNCKLVMDTCSQHFSKATDADLRLIWDRVKGYSLDDAIKAIEQHRIEKGSQAYRPDIQRIASLAANSFRNRQTATRPKQRIVDILRGNNPYAAADDADVIQQHYSECWRDVEGLGDPSLPGSAIARAYIMNGARSALIEIGWEHAEADRMAHLIVGLEPGVKIPKQDVLKHPRSFLPGSGGARPHLELDSPKSWDQLQSLARAEMEAREESSGATA